MIFSTTIHKKKQHKVSKLHDNSRYIGIAINTMPYLTSDTSQRQYHKLLEDKINMHIRHDINNEGQYKQ